ncbi:hypothetical protein K8354_08520 [Polaribacter litorisediminis]|uniref:hypothetical protein n=1 Tax=Polaribacter litorisediminis TaxID=1908341 RepID=UPI001CBD27E9|nr:hypothetical protein [Polaribacter litorisediminis]UAM99828.1 hypothetical protein K8354_08520 [Polaribacter litorisediminis]
MRKILFLLIITFLSFNSFSQDFNLDNLEGKELKNSIRLNYILIDQPDITYTYGQGSTYKLDPKMGLFGLNYNIPLNDWLYTGAGFHGAVYGDQGGLFTLGINLGVNKQLYKNLYFDANIHFGGGGGFRSLVNGGGIIYPNAGLQYKTDQFALGLQYGYVNFFTGIQKGDNISFFVEIPTTLRTTSYKDAQEKFEVNNTSEDEYWQKPAVKSVQQITFDYLFPIGSTRNDGNGNFNNTTPITQTLSLLGFEYQRYLTESAFIYAHVDAMYGGLRAGFMDVFFGIGKNFIESKYINLFAKAGIGAAGGRVFPEGGLTMYPSLGADVKITKKMGISLHGGYHRSVGGTFEAYTAGFSLKYYGLSGGIKDPYSAEKVKQIKTQGVQIGFQNQTYFDVAILDKPDNDLQLLAVKINYDINKRFYVAAEASFAYLGGAGGYAHGIFGIGLKSNKFLNGNFSLFTEALGGVAGGGGVDSGEGILVKPTVGINYHATNDLSFHASAGQMWSPAGSVNSSNINIGLAYGFSVLNAKK